MKKSNIFADMKRITPFVILLVLSALALESCDTTVTPENFFSTTNTEMTYKGGIAEFTVFSNGIWEAQWTDEGVTVTPDNGYGDTKVTVTVPENYFYYDYPVRIEFVTSVDSASHTGKSVVTLHAAPFVTCEDNARIVDHQASVQRFYVNANHSWSVRKMTEEGSVWAGEVRPSSGRENGIWMEVSIPENTGSAVKEYGVEIALDEYPDAEILNLHILQTAPTVSEE